ATAQTPPARYLFALHDALPISPPRHDRNASDRVHPRDGDAHRERQGWHVYQTTAPYLPLHGPAWQLSRHVRDRPLRRRPHRVAARTHGLWKNALKIGRAHV